MPPSTASTTDSVSNCASRCPRLAPIDRRTAISVLRAAARASSRFAMFAHAMRRTTPVIVKRRMSGVFASLWTSLCPC